MIRMSVERWATPWRAAAAVVVALAVPAGAWGVERPPDLVSDAPSGPYLETHVSAGAVTRLLLRFDGFVHNRGLGPLHVEGNPQIAGSVSQYIYDENGTARRRDRSLPVLFETNDQHDHFHLMKTSEYSLWNEAGDALVAPAEKVGFCLYDIERMELDRGPATGVYEDPTFCRQGQPAATSLLMGVSAGWRDTYDASLALQWVDVSSTLPGRYRLASLADPDDVITETVESNPRGFSASLTTIPGHVAQPAGATGAGDAPVTVTLASTTFGTPGSRTFTITAAPANGVLNVAAGSPFGGSTVTYTPNPAFRGTDTFQYTAGDSTSRFPRNPARATGSVTITNGSGTPPPAPTGVTISGAPASLVAGTSAQLQASVQNGPAGVTWTVNGTPGNADVGSVTSTGLYTAPATPPPVGSVRVRATSTSTGAFGEAPIQITPKPTQIPAPSPTGQPGAGSSTTQPASDARARASVRGPWLTVRAIAPQTGNVMLRATARSRTLIRCVVAATRGRAVRCAVRLAKPPPMAGITVGVTMVPRSRRAELTRPLVQVIDGFVTARATPGRSGMIVLVVRDRRRVLWRCSVKSPARRPAACSRATKRASAKGLSVIASLRTPARVVTSDG